MAQTIISITDPGAVSGSAFVGIHNAVKFALRSLESGPTAPSGPVAGVLWLDTSDSNAMHLNIHDGASWVNWVTLDAANNRIRLALDNDRDTYLAPTGTDGQLAFTAEGSVAAMLTATGIAVGTAAPAVAIDAGGRTDALRLPSGTTAQRPSSPRPNDIRHNSTLAIIERWNGTAWEEVGTGSSDATTLVSLTDVTTSNQSSGQVLVATGTNTWANGRSAAAASPPMR